MGRQIG